MRKYKKEFFLGLTFIILFFIIETYSKNELLLTVLSLIFGLTFLNLPNEKSVKKWLFVIGLFLGLLIEVFMGFFGRSQYWSYGMLFGVPLWLPLVWALGFEVIYIVGKAISDLYNK